MDLIRVSARTLDEAITKASIELETTSSNLEYTIIEKGNPGLLGFIGSKPVVIQAVRKKDIEDFDDNVVEVIKEELPNIDVFEKQDIPAQKETVIKKEEKLPEKKHVDGRIYEESAKKFLMNLFKAMGMEVEIQASYERSNKELSVNMSGVGMGILIGKRGQTLDSLQYLVSLVVNKDCEGYVRVKLDTENYRARRKDTLESLAKNIAYKVKRTKRPVSLEPMNPYERRIIHSALQHDKYVVTRSDGEEPFRHVVISLKKEHRNNYQS